MRASTGLFPRLGRYFSTTQQLADSACMTRPTLLLSLQGTRKFTDQEKRAIVNSIITQMVITGNDEELQDMVEALTDFDKVFRRRDNA